MEYKTIDEVARSWNVTRRYVQQLCHDNKIPGVIKKSGVWFIPKQSKKPNENQSVSTKNEIRVLSLFSGCGGMDLGFEGGFTVASQSYNMRLSRDWGVEFRGDKVYLPRTRFKTVFANDIRPDAQTAWLSYFNPDGSDDRRYCVDSIVDLVKLEKENHINVFPKDIDVVTGGFPCQDFSVAGKRQGFNSKKTHIGKPLDPSVPSEETRGLLYTWMREVIALTQPKLFIAENVKGLTNLGDVKEVIEKDFASIGNGGYHVFPARVLLAANYGVPQSRERVFFIGLKKSALKEEVLERLSLNDSEFELDPYPVMTHSMTNEVGTKPFCTLKDIFSDLEEPDKTKDIDQQKYSKAKYMGSHCQGQSEVRLDSIGPTIRSEHHGNIEYRRLSIEHGGRYVDELDAGMIERRLTIRECARIQTFPDNYKFIQSGKDGRKNVSASDAYKLIGNAVPPLLAYALARRIEELWDSYFK